MAAIPPVWKLLAAGRAMRMDQSGASWWRSGLLRALTSGLLVTLSAPCLCATNYTYDSVGRLTSANDGKGTVNAYSYDAAGNILSHTITKVAVDNLDVDASAPQTKYDARTDGLLTLRYMFGLTGPSMSTGAVSATATRTDAASIKSYLDGMGLTADIDGNGRVDPLTDGLLILRYLFGLRGAALIAGVVDAQGTRKTAADIESYIQSLLP